MKKYAVAGIVPEILDLKYLYLETTSQIYYNKNQAPSASEVSSIIQNNANAYADSSEMNKYGARFKYSKFLKLIDDRSMIRLHLTLPLVAIRRDVNSVLNQLAEYSIGFGNQFHISRMGGFNIRSSGFRVAGITRTVYHGDFQIPTERMVHCSSLLLNNPNATIPTIVRRNVGELIT